MTSAVRGCLGEAELMALLAGEGELGQRAHLEACTACQEVVALLGSREAAPRRIDRYEIRRELGRGAMGTVFLAHDSELDRSVALKVLRARGSDVEQRLKHEARSLARLSHPNVVAVFDVGVFEGEVFMTLEHVDGTSLRSWLREQPRRREEILASFLQAGEGLVAAHAAGIVHRDFKPDNVLVGRDGRVRVVDFGLAHVDTIVETRSRTSPAMTTTIHTEGLVGTPAYMAPEQFLGQAADARSDQFAFAVSLAEGLFGERPFRASSFEELRDRTTRGDVSLRGTRFDPVIKVLRRALSPRAEDRWASMSELLAELRRLRSRPSYVSRLAGLAGVVVVGLAAMSSGRHFSAHSAAASASVSTAPSARIIVEPELRVVPEAPSLAPTAPAPVTATLTPRAVKTARTPPQNVSRSPETKAPVRLGANDTPLLE